MKKEKDGRRDSCRENKTCHRAPQFPPPRIAPSADSCRRRPLLLRRFDHHPPGAHEVRVRPKPAQPPPVMSVEFCWHVMCLTLPALYIHVDSVEVSRTQVPKMLCQLFQHNETTTLDAQFYEHSFISRMQHLNLACVVIKYSMGTM